MCVALSLDSIPSFSMFEHCNSLACSILKTLGTGPIYNRDKSVHEYVFVRGTFEMGWGGVDVWVLVQSHLNNTVNLWSSVCIWRMVGPGVGIHGGGGGGYVIVLVYADVCLIGHDN